MTLAINIIHTLLITATAVGLALLSNVATRLFVDLKKEKRMREEAAAYQRALRQAITSGDKAKEAKLRRKEKQMREVQMKVSMGRFKVTGLFILPFIAIYWLLTWYVGGYDVPVAVSPIYIPYISDHAEPAGAVLKLFWWYFISSLALSSPIGKLAGTSPT